MKKYLLASLLALSLQSHSAEISVIDGRYDGERYVSIEGDILSGDLGKIKAAAKQAIREGHNALTLYLNSSGGDVVEAMSIGRWARELAATTYVYGNGFYDPDTPAGKEQRSSRYERKQSPIKIYYVKQGEQYPEGTLTACYSACVLIFYGGVNRHASDNYDFRNGYGEKKEVPVIGLHRPYYAKEKFAALSPAQAQVAYSRLEQEVRGYLAEMGAPSIVVDRMFRSASNEIDLVPSEEFAKFYQVTEPFNEEWLIAKCSAFGPAGALSDDEQKEWARQEQALHQAIKKNRINSGEDYRNFVAPGLTRSVVDALTEKVQHHNRQSMGCRSRATRQYQREWADGPKA